MTTAPSTDSWWGRFRAVWGGFPFDLLGISVLAALVPTVLLRFGGEFSLLRALVGLAFVLVLPGYALVSMVFPGRPTGSRSRPAGESPYSPPISERLGLSFAFSLALIPILALAHSLLGISFETNMIASSVTVLVIGLSAIGAVRRFRRSPTERYTPPSLLRGGTNAWEWIAAGTMVDTVLSVVLLVAVSLAVGGLAFGLAAPIEGDSYTGVSLVTQSGDGEFVASNYPTNVTAGEAQNLTLQIENHYQTTGSYTAVVELQRVRDQGTQSVDVVQRERLGRFRTTIPANETWTRQHSLTPTMTGSDLRLTYYVYRGEVPETPTTTNAERSVHLWVTVR